MSKLRGLIPQSLVKQDVAWGTRQPLVCSKDVGDLHQVIVNYISQMIGRISVRLEEDKVVQGAVIEGHFSLNQVVEAGRSLKRGLEPNYWGDVLSFQFVPLLLAQVATAAVVGAHGFLALGHFGAHLCKPLRGAIAFVSVASLLQLLRTLLI